MWISAVQQLQLPFLRLLLRLLSAGCSLESGCSLPRRIGRSSRCLADLLGPMECPEVPSLLRSIFAGLASVLNGLSSDSISSLGVIRVHLHKGRLLPFRLVALLFLRCVGLISSAPCHRIWPASLLSYRSIWIVAFRRFWTKFSRLQQPLVLFGWQDD